MRIISGNFKGRRINAPANLPIRPTTDFAKEGLFNILNNHINYLEVAVLDLFAGTGSISYEFLSRGCIEATTVELNSKCIEFMHKTKQTLLLNNFFIVKADVFSYLLHCHKSFDLIFADPPYDMAEVIKYPDLILDKNILNKNGLLIIEHDAGNSFEAHPHFIELRKYGKVNFSIFKKPNTVE
jgi:16S rRNA (guanine(966)-N(2))-methyltransferase RsmD